MSSTGRSSRLVGALGRGCRRRATFAASHRGASWQCRWFGLGASLKSDARETVAEGHGLDPAIKSLLKVSPEVRDALAANRPVVALESTIYTHGALNVDLRLEAIVRENGAVPAVVGILDGVPTVGLAPAEIDRMVHEGAKKVSRRDMAFLVGMGMLGNRKHGGTTIAGTMILARLAGIRVFGTGGLGGVHRGWQNHMDISADLTELGRTRVAVISSGCKGFLDIPATLEYLETQGVLVSTFADGRDAAAVSFPAFWARESNIRSPSVVQDEKEAAAMILAQESLGVESGLLFANPIPHEHAVSRADMEAVIDRAVHEATEQGFSGNENTPFILRRIRELTDGRSVPANIALVQHNVARAAKVARELSQLIRSSPSSTGRGDIFTGPMSGRARSSETASPKPVSTKADIVVAGSVAVDLSCDFVDDAKHSSPRMHTSNPASIRQSIGGVGHNIALAAHRASPGSTVRLCSMVGDDIAGSTVLATLEASGLDTSCVRILGGGDDSARTAQYVAVNGTDKNLVLAMADMDIFVRHASPDYAASVIEAAKPAWLVVDANWSSSAIGTWLSAGRKHGAKTAFEPVSVAKSTRLFPSSKHRSMPVFPSATVDLATPNQLELEAMYQAAKENGYLDTSEWFGVIDAFGMRGARDRFVKLSSAEITDAGIPAQSIQLLPYIPTIITKMGANGVLLVSMLGKQDSRLYDREAEPFILARSTNDHPEVGGVYMRYFPPVERVEDVVSVNGVGDTFLGVMTAGLAMGGRAEDLVDVAQKAAVLTLRSPSSVSEELGDLAGEFLGAARRRQ